jgi:hypothetical protein
VLRKRSSPSASQLTRQAADLLETDHDRAEALYRRAVTLDPTRADAWFDLGLIYKWSHRWEESFDCNLRSANLIGEKRQEPAWWNLGIAATALHRWETARQAWRAYGVELADGVGPIEDDLGLGVVRLNPTTNGETVWGRRIDPARMRLVSIPFAASGHRWADIVLHDGSPAGQRESNGRTYTVFDEIHRWAPSDIPTVQATVVADSVADIDVLIDAVDQAGFAAEDWTRNTRLLCKRCSEGRVHEEHDGHDEPAIRVDGEFVIGVAGHLEPVRELVDQWALPSGRQCVSLDVVR